MWKIELSDIYNRYNSLGKIELETRFANKFDSNGMPRMSRVPTWGAVIFQCEGKRYFPQLAGSYILVGGWGAAGGKWL
jgi:hypothetical protein